MISESLLINFLGVILLILLFLTWYLNNNFGYWKKKGVPFVKPVPFFGNFTDLFLFKRPFDIIFYDLYKELEGHSFAGVFHSRIPGVMIRDQELAKDILVRDFNDLPDRGLKVGGPEDPLSQNLFNLEGNKWKWLRAKLSPVFTSGKIKGMYLLMVECAKNMQKELDRMVDSGSTDTDTRDLVARFTTDVIGSTAFGINCNTIANPDSEFRRMSKRIFGGSFMNLLRQFVVFFMPAISKKLKIKDLEPEVEEFFLGMVRDTVKHRMENNVTRNDFLQLLIELKKKGSEEDAAEYARREHSAKGKTEEKFGKALHNYKIMEYKNKRNIKLLAKMLLSQEPQILWNNFLERTNLEERTLYIYGTFIMTTIFYWLLGGVYTFFDLTNKPAVLRRYKVQPGTNEPVDTQKLIQVARVVIFNQIFIGIPFIYTFYIALEWRGHAPINTLPTFNRILIELIVFVFMEEICFYYSHRLLHNRYLYRYIHKQHHEWTSPISITAIYCHPIEYAFADLLPLYSGVFIMGSHIVTMWVWAIIAITSVLSDHSDYHFPFARSPRFHDYHHLKFNQCYGLLGILDRLHGTDELFRKSETYKHHNMLLTFKSVKESNFEK